jgi:amino-acid N-acetyltransferase
MKLRRAVKTDYPQIQKLVAKFPKQLMPEVPPVGRFFVAVVGGAVIGCCALDIYSQRIAEIRSLAVHPKYQKLGLGAKLVTRCLRQAQAKGISEVFAITGRPEFFGRLGLKTFQKEKVAVFKNFK